MNKLARFSFVIDVTTKFDLFVCMLCFKQKNMMQAFRAGELDCVCDISRLLSVHTQKWCVVRETSHCSQWLAPISIPSAQLNY